MHYSIAFQSAEFIIQNMKKRLPQIPEFWVICSRNIGAVFTKSATFLDKKLNKIDGAWIEFERFPPEHMARV